MTTITETTTRKLMFVSPRRVELAEEVLRPLRAREVQIRTLFSGISRGTEMNLYRGEAAFFSKEYDPKSALFQDHAASTWRYPIEFGYENVGRIVQVGAQVTELEPGAIVITYQPHREVCIIDLDSRDPLLGDVMPVLVLPGDMPAEQGVFVPLLAVAFNGMLDAQVLLTESVVIFGAGVVGLLMVQLVRRAGAGRIYVVEPSQRRRRMALALGADDTFDPRSDQDIAQTIREATGGRGADVALEASGTYKGLHEAIRVVGANGRVVACSWLAGAGSDLRLGEEFHLNRVRIMSSQASGINPLAAYRWDKARRTSAALQLLGDLQLADMITHRFPLDRAAEAYRMVDTSPDDVLQVIFTYGDSD